MSKQKTKNKNPELRMYFLVMYNLSPIQQGIQCLHAVVEYFLKYWKTKEFWSWARKHKTVILLNGGTSNDGIKSIYGELKNKGSMENHLETLKQNKIKCAAFKEPDLNGAMSSIAFLVDERVFNKKDYPDIDLSSFNKSEKSYITKEEEIYYASRETFEDGIEKFKNDFAKKVGKDVFFLKEFLKQFRLA